MSYQNNMQDAEECLACYGFTCDQLLPCKHYVCASCTHKWLVGMKKMNCPMCRQVVVSVSPSLDVACKGSILSLHPKPKRPVGVAMRNHAQEGVVIVKVVKDEIADCAGVKPGDWITHINNIPILQHAHAASIIDRASEHGMDIELRLRRPTRVKGFLEKCLYGFCWIKK